MSGVGVFDVDDMPKEHVVKGCVSNSNAEMRRSFEKSKSNALIFHAVRYLCFNASPVFETETLHSHSAQTYQPPWVLLSFW